MRVVRDPLPELRARACQDRSVPVPGVWRGRPAASLVRSTAGPQLDTPGRFQLRGRRESVFVGFQTPPAWRGQGIYPRLLQAILHNEGVDDRRFWIITAPENVASARGIQKAGFQPVAELAFTQAGRAALAAAECSERVRAGASLLGVPVIESGPEPRVSPCWCCVIDALRNSATAVCWEARASGTTFCTCG